MRIILVAARTTGELDNQALAHEIGSMEGWNDVTRIHGIFILNEAEAIHELDLGDLPSAMGREVILDILLGGCKETEQLVSD